eukprot:Sspe_Gene.82535::Locus_54093_Transcript_1_2_Confidence_1.000_Length_1805::g.82535::m.82535
MVTPTALPSPSLLCPPHRSPPPPPPNDPPSPTLFCLSILLLNTTEGCSGKGGHLMTKPKLVLATDLDGTFLGGLMRERYKLYEAIRRHREHVMLVYVTGRSLTNVTCLLDDIPVPDYIIGSTGASVFRHADGDWEVVEPVQGWIDESWGNSRQKVIEMLEGERGLVLDTCDECFYQASPLDCDECSKLSKVSFYYDDTASLGTLREMITEAGFTPIIS